MLTATLRGLERDGLLTRTIFPTNPPRVDYELTDLGRDLTVPVIALGKWAMQNQDRIAAARSAFDARLSNARSVSHRSFARMRARSTSGE